jgi:hypothetical protein
MANTTIPVELSSTPGIVDNSNATAITIDSSENVGIGLANPSDYYAENLVVAAAAEGGITIKSATTDHGYLMFADGTSGNEAYRAYISHAHDGDTTNLVSFGSIGLSSVNETTFSTNSTERMRIDTSGNLLVGTTSNLGRITANGADGVAAIGTTVATAINYNAISFHNNAGTQCGRILVNNAGTTEYITSSDERLKENITDANDAGSKIDAIKVRQYDWKADGSHQDYGMIAQELVEVAPEAVSVPENPEEMMGVDYSKLVPMLVKEIQSLRNRVAQLEE